MFATSLAARLLPVLALATCAHAQIVHVDQDLTTGAADGSSWDNAFRGVLALQNALAAAPDGAEIWVTGGTYRPAIPGLPSLRYDLVGNSITLRGGFVGTESSIHQRPEPGAFPTVLSGDLAGNDDGTAASAAENTRTILEVQGVDITLENLDVVGGAAGHPGLLVDDVPGIRIERCRFLGNFGTGARVEHRSRVEPLTVVDCEFMGNGLHGAYVRLRGFPQPPGDFVVARNIAVGNSGSGFVLTLPEIMAGLDVSNLVSARNGGWGIDVETFDEGIPINSIHNCTLVDNQAGGVRQRFCQCIFGELSVVNSIVRGSSGQPFAQWAVNVNSIGTFTDPLFVDAAGGDYRLRSTSPAIDRGDIPTNMTELLDARRSHRDVDLPGAGTVPNFIVDAGAYEFTGSIGDNGGCDALPNSTGQVGRLFARGSAEVSAGGLTLRADRLPPGQFCLFLASRRTGLVLGAGGPGTLCLGGTIGRFNAPGQVQLADGTGVASLPIDIQSIPEGGAFAAAQPGETWRFQVWHRDVPMSSQFSGVVGNRRMNPTWTGLSSSGEWRPCNANAAPTPRCPPSWPAATPRA